MAEAACERSHDGPITTSNIEDFEKPPEAEAHPRNSREPSNLGNMDLLQ